MQLLLQKLDTTMKAILIVHVYRLKKSNKFWPQLVVKGHTFIGLLTPFDKAVAELAALLPTWLNG